MSHAHHQYLFDYRYKDLETGKLNIDKLGTINSYNLSDLIESHGGGCYEFHVHGNYVGEDNSYQGLEEKYNACMFPEREKELQRKKKKEEALERKRQKEIEQREQERSKAYRELEEYRERLRARENELARQKLMREEREREFNHANSWGKYIITNSGKVRQG